MSRCRLFFSLVLATGLPLFPQEPAPAVDPPGGKPVLDGKLWGGVVYAGPKDKGLPGEEVSDQGKTFGKLVPQLSKAFPESGEFTLIGEGSGDLFRQYESWIVPSRDFYFKLDSEGMRPEMKGLRVHLQIWRKKDVMLKTDVVLSENQPVFVSGPKWREGRILFLIALKEAVQTKED